jgi:hypothetical protein
MPNELEVRKQYQIEITNRFAALENLDSDGDIHRAWENMGCTNQSSINHGLMKNV